MKKNKKILIILIAISLIIAALLFYPAITGQIIGNQQNANNLKNPVVGLSDEQAKKNFDESYIKYLLYRINADELKNLPFSSDTPKIEIKLDEETYNAEIIKKSVKVGKGEIENEDIVIRTTKEEIIKTMREEQYLATSFKDGLTSIQLITTKTELFGKGYLQLYQELSAKSTN